MDSHPDSVNRIILDRFGIVNKESPRQTHISCNPESSEGCELELNWVAHFIGVYRSGHRPRGDRGDGWKSWNPARFYMWRDWTITQNSGWYDSPPSPATAGLERRLSFGHSFFLLMCPRKSGIQRFCAILWLYPHLAHTCFYQMTSL